MQHLTWPTILLWFLSVTILAADDLTKAHPYDGMSRESYGRMPLGFQANQGQAPPSVRFLTTNADHSLLLRDSGLTMVLDSHKGKRPEIWSLDLAGAARAHAEGLDKGREKVSYFIGDDPSRWITGITTFQRVRYRNVYPGIDWVLYGDQRRLEYDFVVQPGADPRRIRVRFRGIQELSVSEDGNLRFLAGDREVVQYRPRIFQETEGGRQEVAGGFVKLGTRKVGFETGPYDHSRPLVIDPTIVSTNVIGGSKDDIFGGIAIDSLGRSYITGITFSTDFPTKPTATIPVSTMPKIFVTRFNPGTEGVDYSVIVGGAGNNYAQGIAIDALGQAYVTGATDSQDFPTSNPIQSALGGGLDAVVFKLGPTGTTMPWSTYVGGSNTDSGQGVVLDNATLPNVFITGYTQSQPGIFPATAGKFPVTAGAFQTTLKGASDAFIIKISQTQVNQPTLAASTLYGGNGTELGNSLVLFQNNVFIAGGTSSTDLPMPSDAAQSTFGGGIDAFFAGFNQNLTTLNGATYHGGSGVDIANGLAVDSNGNLFGTGFTFSTNLPVTSNATQPTYAGGGQFAGNPGGDAFVTVFNPLLTQRTFSTYLGTPQDDVGQRVLVTGGSTFVVGGTYSGNTGHGDVWQSAAQPTATWSSPPSYYNQGVFTQGPADWEIDGVAAAGNQVCFGGSASGNDAWSDTSTTKPPGHNSFVVCVNPQTSKPLLFHPITPCRVADTRNPNGPFGGPLIQGGTTRSFPIPDSSCGVPPTAQAYSLNASVVPNGPLGFMTIFPTGQTQPLASTLNSLDGRIKGSAAIVPSGSNGAINIFVTDPTHVILDINGYFAPSSQSGGQVFFPVTPCRVADTRNATGLLGGPMLLGETTRVFPFLSSDCGLSSSAQALSLNFAAVPPNSSSLGFLTAWPTGQPQPLVSTLNDLTGTIVANAAIVPTGQSGETSVFVTDSTQLVIDTNGYFAPPATGGLSLYPITPCRVIDTRLPAGTPPFTGTRNVDVLGSPCGLPSTARAYVFSVTVVPPGPLGFMTMWPQGQPQPVVSTLNAFDGFITSNMAIVPAGTNGGVSMFPSASTHVVIDVNGYFAP